MSKYFLYARKSTDVEDKQILSIEAQLAELREIAKRDNLNITEEFVEKKSAKKPGRPMFGRRRANPMAFAEWGYCSYSNARPQLLSRRQCAHDVSGARHGDRIYSSVEREYFARIKT